jgi:hypothetical protein
MRIPIKPLSEEKRIKANGKASIYFQYFHDGEHRTEGAPGGMGGDPGSDGNLSD